MRELCWENGGKWFGDMKHTRVVTNHSRFSPRYTDSPPLPLPPSLPSLPRTLPPSRRLRPLVFST